MALLQPSLHMIHPRDIQVVFFVGGHILDRAALLFQRTVLLIMRRHLEDRQRLSLGTEGEPLDGKQGRLENLCAGAKRRKGVEASGEKVTEKVTI